MQESSLKENTRPMLTPPSPVSSEQRQGSLLRLISQRWSVCFSPGQAWAAGLIPLSEPMSPALWPAWDEGGAQLAWLGTWRMGRPSPVGGGDDGKEATTWGPAAWGSPGATWREGTLLCLSLWTTVAEADGQGFAETEA